jgi:hypothetical protein
MELLIIALISLMVLAWTIRWMLDIKELVKSVNRALVAQGADSERRHKELMLAIRGETQENLTQRADKQVPSSLPAIRPT